MKNIKSFKLFESKSILLQEILNTVPDKEVIGKEFWFEYHCWESPKSCDSELWYRSHQKVKVIDRSQDGHDEHPGESKVFKVKFEDGFKGDVFADELMNSPEEFYRPNPPDKISENKMWYKSISHILDWLKEKSNKPWILLDTETTGLGGPKKEQLTQISTIACEYNFNTNTFKEIGEFDDKIKLTDQTKSKYNDKGDKTKWVLKFNHYGSGGYKYKDEKETIVSFFDFVSEYEPCLLVAQNAKFDMEMLSARHNNRIENEVFDTKHLIQLYFLPLLQKLSETDPKYKEMIDFIGTSDRDNGLISSSMSKIGPVLGVNMEGYHDALTDCRLMMEMYQKIVDILKENKDVDISKYQLERIKTKK